MSHSALGPQFSHPDDAVLNLKLDRGRWRAHAQPLPSDFQWGDLKEGVYEVPTHRLKVSDPGRVRKKSGSALEKKIAEKGINNPLHVSLQSSGGMALADGNHRLQVAKNLGLETVPVLATRMTPDRMKRWYGR